LSQIENKTTTGVGYILIVVYFTNCLQHISNYFDRQIDNIRLVYLYRVYIFSWAWKM